jgi:Flp pilus assembly protein TadD
VASHDQQTPTDSVAEASDIRARLVHQETVRLIQLGILAVAAFFVTRALAVTDREMTRQSGIEWYDRGTRLLTAGDAKGAADAFRRAVVTNRRDPRYALALADALVRQHELEPARAALLALRRTMPEHPEINLQLARLAAARDNVGEAISYYHNALYAPWRPGDESRRRQIRLELIDFLLDQHQANAAISELVALGADAPDDPRVHIELARRFARAGDNRSALAWFQRALRRTPQDTATLMAAGEAAFALGDYRLAHQYFRGMPKEGVGTATGRVVDLIITNDPLAVRLGASERRRRLVADIAYAERRLDECRAPTAGSLDSAAEDLTRRAHLAEKQLQSRRSPDMDTIEAGVALMYELLAAARRSCAETPHDRALILLAQHHGADKR